MLLLALGQATYLKARDMPMPDKDFLTYNEYKLLCYRRGCSPLRRGETGPFVRNIRTRETPRKDLSEVFALLCSQDGVITQESLRGHVEKFGLNREAIAGLFEVMQREHITAEEFCQIFGCI